MEQDIQVNGLNVRGVTLEQLRAFVFIAKHGGFSRAGEELGRTQSTLSTSLKRLEEMIGCTLINRQQGHIIGLTNEGQQLLPAAQDILSRMSGALQSVRNYRLEGKITLGVPADFRIMNLNRVISWCLGENPGLKIEIIAADSLTLALLSERKQLDIIIRKEIAGQPVNQENERILYVEQLHWVSSKSDSFNEIPEIPLVTFFHGCVIRACAIDALERVRKPYFLSYTSGSFDNIREAVKSGLGIALLPQNALTEAFSILSHDDGAPSVSAVQLVLAVKTQGELYELFADYLRRSLIE